MSGGEVLRTVMLKPQTDARQDRGREKEKRGRGELEAPPPVAESQPQKAPREAPPPTTAKADSISPPATEQSPGDSPSSVPPPREPDLPPVDAEQLQTIDIRQMDSERRAEFTRLWNSTPTERGEAAPPRPGDVGATVDFAAEQTVHEGRSLNRHSTLIVPPRTVAHPDRSRPDDEGSDYELLGIIGRGGVGVVYSARQASIHRTVAVKMLRDEYRDDEDQREKFLAEAVVTGDLDHPNIVPIHDLGADEAGALFYVMKRVKGRPWSDRLDAFSLRENLDVLLKTCDAIAFAHSRGVIHRDIKPENVMLGDFGEVLVMDWGIAIGTANFEKTEVITQSNAMGGTPAYMSPEMTTGPLSRIGPTSDVYLLGAVLFEIINGRPPHHGRTVTDCIAAAGRNEIVPHRATGELAEIAAKAMATAQSERYASVPEFQAAIRSYLAHAESILLAERGEALLEQAQTSGDYEDYARAVFAFVEAYELWDENDEAIDGAARAKWRYAEAALAKGDLDLAESQLSRDNPDHGPLLLEIAGARREQQAKQRTISLLRRAAAVLVVLLIVVMAGAATWIRSEKQAADQAKAEAETATSNLEVQRASAEQAIQQAADAERLVDQAQAQIADAEMQLTSLSQESAAMDLRMEFTGYFAKISSASSQLADNGFAGARTALAACPPALRGWEWRRLVHVCSQGETLATVPESFIALDAEGEWSAALDASGRLHVFNQTDHSVFTSAPQSGRKSLALFRSQGELFAVIGGESPAPVLTVQAIESMDALQDARVLNAGPSVRSVQAVAVSSDGEVLAYGADDGSVGALRISDGSDIVSAEPRHNGMVHAVAVSPAGDLALSAGADNKVLVHRLTKTTSRPGELGAPIAFREHASEVLALCFSPDGQWAASAGSDGRVLVWQPRKVEEFDYSGALGGDAAERSTKIQLFSGVHGAGVRSLSSAVGDSETSPAWLLASGGVDRQVILWEVVAGSGASEPTMRQLATFRGHAQTVEAVACLPGGERIVSAGADGRVVFWDAARYSEYRRLAAGAAVASVKVSSDGSFLAAASADGAARVYDVQTGELRDVLTEGHEFLLSTARLFADGRRLLTAGGDRTARLWDVPTGTELAKIDGPTFAGVTAISGDEGVFAVGIQEEESAAASANHAVLLGSTETYEVLQRLGNGERPVGAVAVNRDASRVYVGDADTGAGVLWEGSPQAGYIQRTRMRAQYNGITAARFIDDGRLATLSLDGTWVVWKQPLAGDDSEKRIIRLKGPATTGAFSRDGRRALSACTVVRGDAVEEPKCFLEFVDFDRPDAPTACEFDAALLTAVCFSLDESEAIAAGVLDSDAQASRAGALRDQLWTWDLTGAAPRPLWEGIENRTLKAGLAVAPNGALVTAGGSRVHFWDMNTGAELRRIGPLASLRDVAISQSGRRLATADAAGYYKIWRLGANPGEAVAERMLGDGTPTAPAVATCFAQGDDQFVAACDDGVLRTWDVVTGSLSSESKLFDSRPVAMMHRDDDVVLVAGQAGETILWSLSDRKEIRKLDTPVAELRSAALSPDGTLLALGWAAGGVSLWQVAEDVPATPAEVSGKPVAVALAFVPGEDRLAVAGRDGAVSIHELSEDGAGVLAISGHSDALRSVTFSKDGALMATGSRDGTAVIWPAPFDESPAGGATAGRGLAPR